MADAIVFRRGMRWANVSGSRGKWHCAQGWRGEVKASSLHSSTWPTKAGAIICAKGWIGDSTAQELEIGRKRDQEERADDKRLRALLGDESFRNIPPRPRYKSK